MNYIQEPTPGTRTGKAPDTTSPASQPGALGLGHRAAVGITAGTWFWICLTSVLGAYLADLRYGRLPVINQAVAVTIGGLVITTISAAPAMIAKVPNSLALLVIGVIIAGLGIGCLRSSIIPFVAEQVASKKRHIRILKSGEMVIVDPDVTTSKIYHWFYGVGSLGALVGQIVMMSAEWNSGYWAAFLIPTIALSFMAPVLLLSQKSYNVVKPQPSAISIATKLLVRGCRSRISLNPIRSYRQLNDGTFWTSLRPSEIPPEERPSWYTFDDDFVDELGRGLSACSIFLWFPLFWYPFGHASLNMKAQAITLTAGRIPDGLTRNLTTVFTILLIPVYSGLIYPTIRRFGFYYTPIKRMMTGFLFCAVGIMLSAALQPNVHNNKFCGNHVSKCAPDKRVSIAAQIPAAFVLGAAEVLTVVTALEYAFNKAPKCLRSTVVAFGFLMMAAGALIGAITYPTIGIPIHVGGHLFLAGFAIFSGVVFGFFNRKLDKQDVLTRHAYEEVATHKVYETV